MRLHRQRAEGAIDAGRRKHIGAGDPRWGTSIRRIVALLHFNRSIASVRTALCNWSSITVQSLCAFGSKQDAVRGANGPISKKAPMSGGSRFDKPRERKPTMLERSRPVAAKAGPSVCLELQRRVSRPNTPSGCRAPSASRRRRRPPAWVSPSAPSGLSWRSSDARRRSGIVKKGDCDADQCLRPRSSGQ